MSGHSKWKSIKHKKEAADQKRGQLFSKLLAQISIAARADPNPEFNPRLRAAMEKARENQVPQENILRAIKRASEDKNLEELVIESYGPEGAGILIEAITDNKNRTISEIKKILNKYNAKWAEPGSVRWAFEQKRPAEDNTQTELESSSIKSEPNHRGSAPEEWRAKFKQNVSEEAKQKLQAIKEELENRDDVQGVYTNTQ